MNFTVHTWQHGDIITADQLNRLENQINSLSQNTYDSTVYANTASSSDKIALQSTVTNAINALDKTINLSDVSDVTLDTDVSTDYRKVLSSITETDGKLASLKYAYIPVTSTSTLGLVKVGDNLTANGEGVLSANYSTSGTYNASSNPLVTVSAMKTALSSTITNFTQVAISGNDYYQDSQLTVTGVGSRDSTNGTITLSREPIAITQDQIIDVYVSGNKDSSGTYANKYQIPTVGTVSTMIGNIATASDQAAGLMSITHYNKLQNLDAVPDLTSEQLEEKEAAGNSWTDPRANGLITPQDSDSLHEIEETFGDFFVFTDGKVTGVKVYDDTGENYKILTYDEISATSVAVE